MRSQSRLTGRHCERSEAIQGSARNTGLPHCARNDDQTSSFNGRASKSSITPRTASPASRRHTAAVIGILSVPDVLRISSAYQQADKELGARRQKLNEDAQKEQIALRDLGQALGNDRAKMTPEQIRNNPDVIKAYLGES